MGYTHYWYKNYEADADTFEGKYAELLPIVKQIVQFGSVELEGNVSPEYIHLNGREDDGHETFVWLRGKNVGGMGLLMDMKKFQEEDEPAPKFSKGVFSFCKTARKPYDTIVVAILCAIQDIYGDELVKISSDGDMVHEWAEGRELFERANKAVDSA
mgnify:CR=1 FL=1